MKVFASPWSKGASDGGGRCALRAQRRLELPPFNAHLPLSSLSLMGRLPSYAASSPPPAAGSPAGQAPRWVQYLPLLLLLPLVPNSLDKLWPQETPAFISE